MNESSFFKGMGGFNMNVERSGSVVGELKQKQDENLALKEINEQYLNKIQTLQTQLQDIEDENRHLEQEHLLMLKQQQQNIGKQSTSQEESTIADSRDDEMANVKDKQIDFLSSSLATKEVEIKSLKLTIETEVKDAKKV